MVQAGLLIKRSPLCLLGVPTPHGKPETHVFHKRWARPGQFWEVAAGWFATCREGSLGTVWQAPLFLNYKMNQNYKMHLTCKKELKQSKITHNEKRVSVSITPQKN